MLNDKEKPIWKALKDIVHGFLGNLKAENFKKLENELMNRFEQLDCNISLEAHILKSHLDFLSHCGVLRNEHGALFR